MHNKMIFLLSLVIVSAVHSSPTGDSWRTESSRSPSSPNREELSDEDILKSLSILLSDIEQDKPRGGRQQDDDELEFLANDETHTNEEQLEGLEESERQSTRGFGFRGPSFSPLEKCEITGYEIRYREECDEVSETECRPISVKKIRTEIIEQCDTLLNKTCGVTYTGVPRQKCSPTTSKRCKIDFNIVEEKLYKEECKVNVQHICEEHFKVPIPYPVYEPYPAKTTYHPHPHGHEHDHPQGPSEYDYPNVVHHDHPHGASEGHYPNLVHHDHPNHNQSPPPPENYLGSPFPSKPPPFLHQPSVLGEALVSSLFKRQKRSAQRKEDNMETLRGLVKQVLLDAVQRKKANETTKEAKMLHHQDHLLPESLHYHLVPELPNFVHHLLPELPNSNSVHDLLPQPPHSSHQLPPDHHVLEHPPIVTTYEVPSEPGCRSFATKTCHKIPIIVSKKEPFETCKEVPDVECVTVLKNVPELECTDEPYEECYDVAKDIPYLEPAEECEEIFFDDCLEVEEKIPVELCKRKRVDEESIFLTRGQIFRKEGEKRRRKIGNKSRKPEQKDDEDDDE